MRAVARANAAHMAGVSHIRLLDGGAGHDWAPSSQPNWQLTHAPAIGQTNDLGSDGPAVSGVVTRNAS